MKKPPRDTIREMPLEDSQSPKMKNKLSSRGGGGGKLTPTIFNRNSTSKEGTKPNIFKKITASKQKPSLA